VWRKSGQNQRIGHTICLYGASGGSGGLGWGRSERRGGPDAGRSAHVGPSEGRLGPRSASRTSRCVPRAAQGHRVSCNPWQARKYSVPRGDCRRESCMRRKVQARGQGADFTRTDPVPCTGMSCVLRRRFSASCARRRRGPLRAPTRELALHILHAPASEFALRPSLVRECVPRRERAIWRQVPEIT
jgi:hypothetical protein